MSAPDSISVNDEFSGPVAAAPAPGPGPTPEPDVPTQKQRLNVYTMMLVLAFFFLVAATILLYMELSLYGSYPWWDTSRAAPVPTSFHYVPGSSIELL